MTLKTKAFGDIITLTRSSGGGRFNSSGVFEWVANDVPRFDYDPVTLQPLGILIDEARTNLVLWSRDLTNAAWGKTNVTPSLTATGIDGVTNSATTLTAVANNGIVLQSITSASAVRATTAYVKRRSGTGVVEMTQNGGVTWAPITINSTSYTRVGPTSATVVNPQIGFRLATSGDQIDVDMVQCESGASATSAIPTGASQVTRAADVASVNTLSPWYNASEGTLYFEGSSFGLGSSSTSYGVALTDGTGNEVIAIRRNVTGFGAAIIDGGVAQASFAPAYTNALLTKIALAYKANDFAISKDGATPLTDASGTIPTVDRLNVGSTGTATSFLNGHIRSLRYWPRRLSNAELQQVTE